MSRPPLVRLFRSESDLRFFGYAYDAAALPPDLGPWRFFSGHLTPGLAISELSVLREKGFVIRKKASEVVPFKKPD